MGDEPELTAQRETVADRVEFIELLDEQGPLPTRDIVDDLPHSRPTVSRALKDLREADLIEKVDGGYVPTTPGLLAADEYRRYEASSEAILRSKELLAAIPYPHTPPVDVFTGADTIRAEGEFPIRPLEALSDRVQQAATVQAFLPALANPHLLRAWHQTVAAGTGDGTAIFDPDLLTVLKGQYPHLLSEMAAAGGFSAVAANGPPYGLLLTETGGTARVTIAVYEEGATMRGILTNSSRDAVEWAQSLFERLEAEGTAVTSDLEALSAAVADGMAQPALAGAGGGPGSALDESAGHSLPLDLETEGFVRLSGEYLDTHSQAAPEVSWRTGFTLAEVHAGHAVERRDADGTDLTDRLVDDLQNGTDHVVLGPPGSGKSTVCMAVACAWYDQDLGPVLYRERGDGDRFESTAMLEAYLRQTDDHALVVVEDAIRDEASGIFGVMQSLETDHSVSFLLDARTHEWRESEGLSRDTRLDAYRRSAVGEVQVPDMDKQACERFVTHFATLVDAELDLTGEELYDLVEEGTAATGDDELAAGDALVAQHYLARRYDPGIEAPQSTALDEEARRTYDRLSETESELAVDLAVQVALLTVAGIPVADAYLSAVAPDDDLAAADAALQMLKGDLLFEPDAPRARQTITYRTRHETWALRFLEQVHALDRDPQAQERVGRCITRLLALADDQDRREEIERHLGGAPHIHRIETDPGRWADEIAERVFQVGQTDANLAPLFGETNGDTIALPDSCSEWTQLQQAYWRGEMYVTHGDYHRAEREFRTLEELCENIEFSQSQVTEPATPGFFRNTENSDDIVEDHRDRWRATSRMKLGEIARKRGEFENAVEHYQNALLLSKEIGDREGEATCLAHLASVALLQSELEQAEEYSRHSLEIARDLDVQSLEATSLNHLGGVAIMKEEFDQAHEYLEQSLTLYREVGNKKGEAFCLANLGTVADNRGAYDQAREYHEQALPIYRELGDKLREAKTLNNLGMSSKYRGKYDQAREYLEQALAIYRSVKDRRGEAQNLRNLGVIANDQALYNQGTDYLEQALTIYRDLDGLENKQAESLFDLGYAAIMRGDYDLARQYHEQSLAMYRELNDREGEARNLDNLGNIARELDNTERAYEYSKEALTIFRDIGNTKGEASTLCSLGTVARIQNSYDEAHEYYNKALENYKNINVKSGIAELRLNQGMLALTMDEAEKANSHAQTALETFDNPHGKARSRLLLGRIAATNNEPEDAYDHWRAALDMFDRISAIPDELDTLKELIEYSHNEEDTTQVHEWLEKARNLLANAHDATAEQHHEWIERHTDNLNV